MTLLCAVRGWGLLEEKEIQPEGGGLGEEGHHEKGALGDP